MGGFFNLDGPFYKFGNIVADIIILGLIWIVFSLPLFTIGASTTAIFYVTTRRISNKDGYLTKDFFNSFKSNFIQSTVIWLFLIFVSILLFVNIKNINVMGSLKNIFLPLQICFAVEFLITAVYIFPTISRFQMKNLQVIKTAFFMANKHFVTSFICLSLGVIIIIGIWFFPPVFLISMSLYAFIASYFIMRIFRKYRPELDKEILDEE